MQPACLEITELATGESLVASLAPSSYVLRTATGEERRALGERLCSGAELLEIELCFDAVEGGQPEGARDIRLWTDALRRMVSPAGSPCRACLVRWGEGLRFHAFLASIELRFSLFAADGVPLRAQARCCFGGLEEGWTEPQQAARTGAQTRVREGESLPDVAARIYGDAAAWPSLARANGIEDPEAIVPGQKLATPALGGDEPVREPRAGD